MACFLEALYVEFTVSSSFCFKILIQQNVPISSPYLCSRRLIDCEQTRIFFAMIIGVIRETLASPVRFYLVF